MMDIASFIRLQFILAAATIVVVNFIPLLSDRLLAYGSRATPKDGVSKNDVSENFSVDERKDSTHALTSLVDTISSFKVPHSWFTSFYVVSVCSSAFWGVQLLFKTSAFRVVAACATATEDVPSMTLNQVIITWAMMMLQGSRRLYESLEFTKASSARMWVGHWALGIWFYLSMSVAVWVEGVPRLLTEGFSLSHFRVTAPSLRTFVATLIFILASGIQHDCHAYLSSLKKYTLPAHPVFQSLICPHYFAECLVYLSLAIAAAPTGFFANRTIFCALVFVAVNLAVTADGTKKWYEAKFGKDKVVARWRMIPFLY